MTFKHNKQCIICGEAYESTRYHAKTCKARCRFVKHKLNVELKIILSHFGWNLRQMTIAQIAIKNKLVQDNKLSDAKGNRMELINGFLDRNNKLIIVVFRNKALKYLELWIDYGNDLPVKYYPYGVHRQSNEPQRPFSR